MKENDVNDPSPWLQDVITKMLPVTNRREREDADLVARTQAELAAVKDEAVQLLAQIEERRQRYGPTVRALQALDIRRYQIMSGNGQIALAAGHLQRLLDRMADLRTEGLAAVPGRIASLTPTQCREKLADDIREVVRGYRSMPAEMDQTMLTIESLAKKLASAPMPAGARTVELKFPPEPPQTKADADFSVYSR
jgi:hypothetical protein